MLLSPQTPLLVRNCHLWNTVLALHQLGQTALMALLVCSLQGTWDELNKVAGEHLLGWEGSLT